MKRTQIAIALILLLGSTVYLIASRNDSRIQPIHLQTEGCQKPCWLGIEVGRASKADAQAIINRQYEPSKVSLESYSDYEKISWEKNSQGGGTVYVVNDVVTDINVWLKEDVLYVGNLYAEIGNPPYVLVETPRCLGASLVYPEIGIVVSLYPINEFVGVKEKQSVYSIEFQLPFTMNNRQVYDGTLKQWDSYRDYCGSDAQ